MARDRELMRPGQVTALILAPLASGALRTRFPRRERRAIMGDAVADYRRHRAALPGQPGLGGRVMVRLAALTAGLYRALRARGLDERDARALTASVTARAYRVMARVPWRLAQATRRKPRARLQRATDLFRRFPFGPPSYRMDDVEAGPDVVAFDVRRCPAAELFRAQGLSTLCREAWCDLDFALAERWGARLERSVTLADGADRCDFRWRVGAPEADKVAATRDAEALNASPAGL